MHRLLFIQVFLLSFSVSTIHAQEIQWASKVIEFSSELSQKEYSAIQIIGKPNVLPEGGDSPNAWLPNNPNKEEFIKVGFDRPTRIQQIAIAESYNPSATYQVYVYDGGGNEYLINTFTPRPIPLKGRLLNILFDQTSYEVHAVKLVLNGISVPGYSGIDAIAISESTTPVEVEIATAPNVTEELATEKLSENVNSEYEEMRPLIAPDGKTLYFSRRNHPENIGGIEDDEDIWYSELDEETGEWLEAENMGEPLNNAGSNFISSVTPDGNSMMVMLGNRYQKNKDMKPGVSVSRKTSQGWTKPEELDILNAFIENNDGHYFLAQNKQTLIMAVERFDSYGDKDIYVTFKQADGRWSEPLNLGNDINTAHTENSPFLAADDETLYFSSKGYSGFGGADIYISRRLDDTWQNWTEPENLGSELNSSEDDVFFNIPPSGKYAYYSKSNSEFDADIHRIELPIFFQPSPVVAFKGHIYNAETKEPIEAKVAYILMPENTEVGHTLSDSITGEYEIVLPVGASYRYVVEQGGFSLLEDTVNLTGEKDFREIERNLFIDPVKLKELATVQTHLASTEQVSPEEDKPDDVIELNEGVLSIKIQFNFDSDVIRKNSYPDLDRIVNLLKSVPVDVIVAGHTDSTGPDEYNNDLSKRRAKSVNDYFVNKGVDSSKLEVAGFGEKHPMSSNDTLNGRRRNRRVEFIRKDQFEKTGYGSPIAGE
jgi:OOP family OmpA-OmpF porin